MGQDPGTDHDSALNDPVSNPGWDPEGERGQGVDEGGAIKDGGDGDEILDNMHDGFGGVADEEVGGDSVTDLLDGEVHGDIALLILALGLDAVLDDDSLTDLIFDNVWGRHSSECFCSEWVGEGG